MATLEALRPQFEQEAKVSDETVERLGAIATMARLEALLAEEDEKLGTNRTAGFPGHSGEEATAGFQSSDKRSANPMDPMDI